MDVDGVRITCPSCGSRLTVMPRMHYLACAHCGSEFTVQRRGYSIGLEPFEPEQFAISKEIAAVERVQSEGCSNVFFWIFLVTGVLFCGLGFASRALFNSSVPLVLGWAVSLVALVVASGVLLRMLNSEREKRLTLEARRQELAEKRGDLDPTADTEI